MKTGSITYNGKNSLTDLGIYVTGSGSFDAAELDVDRYEVAGRNGDIIIPKNRYKNISISYPAFIPKGFDGKVQSVRNWLRSAKTYARLEDTYDMNHYRLGLASGIQSFEPANRNDASNFALTFDCKPQRFLKTGETESKVEVDAHSYTGDLVSFDTIAEDDLTTLKSSIVPVQSLNGYDHPWAGGAGKNLFRMDKNSGETLPLTTGSGATFKVGSDKAIIEATGTASGAVDCILSSYNLLQNYITIPAGTYTISVEGLKAGMRFIFSGVGHNGVPYSELTKTDSQKTVTVTDGTEPFTSISLDVDNGIATNTTIKIQIEAGTAKTSWTPYSNLCPITGHDSATLYRTGKNLAKLSAENAGSNQRSTVVYTDSGATVTATNTYARYGWIIPVKSGQTYTLKCHTKVSGNADYKWLVLASADGAWNSSSPSSITGGYAAVDGDNTFTFTAPKDILFFGVYVTAASPSGVVEVTNVQLELGSSATAYTPYNGTSLTFSLGSTVYGGYLNNDGTGKVTWKSVTLNGTENWQLNTNAGSEYFYVFGYDGSTGNDDLTQLSNMFVAGGNYHYTEVGRFRVQSNGAIVVGNKNYGLCADVTAFKAMLAANNLQVVYELATPTDISLTGQDLNTLLGENNLWADCGEVTVVYADPFSITNPTEEEARPLFRLVNPQQNDVITLNGKTITISTSYTGEMFIDCETMDAFSSSGTNLNSYITATDFPVLKDGLNIVTFSGSGDIFITPRWWEL